MRRTLVTTAAALACGALFAGMGAGVADATDSSTTSPGSSTTAPAPLPEVSSSTATLPLIGAPLTVELTSGPGGALTSVAVNPADGFTATTVKPNKVVFLNEDGTAKVVVNNRHGGQQIEARAGSLADIIGPGGWSGDLFGTGTVTTVGFEVVELDGAPGITNVTSSDPTAEIGAAEQGSHDRGSYASVSIRFTNGTHSRTLRVKVVADPDDDRPAVVKIGLSRIKGVSLPAGEVAGAQTWNGVLCDGTAAQIGYTVAEDGTISGVTVSPEPAEQSTDGNKIRVRFPGGERVSIRVRAHDGELRISVDEKVRCAAPPPEVNTEIDPEAGVSGTDGRDGRDGHDGRGRHGDDDHGDNRGDRNGDDDRDDDGDHGDDRDDRDGHGDRGGDDGNRDGGHDGGGGRDGGGRGRGDD